MTTIDPEQYKAGQRQGWNSVASGWQKWWKATHFSYQLFSCEVYIGYETEQTSEK